MSWFDPRTGLLAAGVPLPPRRPPDLGQPRDDADLPGPRTTPSTPRYTPQQRDALQGLFNQHAQQYPYGRGTAEGEVMSVGPEQFNIRQLNQVLGGPERYSSENVSRHPEAATATRICAAATDPARRASAPLGRATIGRPMNGEAQRPAPALDADRADRA